MSYKLTVARTQCGLTVQQLAEEAQLSTSVVYDSEAGRKIRVESADAILAVIREKIQQASSQEPITIDPDKIFSPTDVSTRGRKPHTPGTTASRHNTIRIGRTCPEKDCWETLSLAGLCDDHGLAVFPDGKVAELLAG